MVRIICPECKDSYLDNKEDSLSCPSCKAVFSKDEENLILGAQYYNECDYDKANDCLMKHIVKNGADAQAIFYKALCDGFCYDEDTLSLADTYNKLFESLKELPEGLFPDYLALANDECEKLEKAVAQSHIHLFVDADAEKIKKEVSTIINLQNEAKAFRIRLNALVNEYNDKAAAKLSVKFSDCFLVDPELATQVGDLKYQKVAENVASHTVFTGILSTDIKNLEIYYRCIVMFFKKNRQKYDFLMASAEKFTELSKLLEDGQYTTIKGTSAIGDKLKSAGYDFFQESLKDNDEEFETQTQTVVILQAEVEEPEQEEAELEDISSTTEAESVEADEEAVNEAVDNVQEAEESEEPDDLSSEAEIDTVAEEDIEAEAEKGNEAEAQAQDDTIIEISDNMAEELTSSQDTEEETVQADAAEIEAAEEFVAEKEEAEPEATDTTENVAEQETVEEAEIEKADSSFETISQEPVLNDSIAPEKPKRKKSYAPFITIFLIIAGIIAIICVTIVPAKLNAKNYDAAAKLMAEGKYAEAVNVYAELGDYEDSADKLNVAKYSYASQLEAAEKYTEAKAIYEELGSYEDSLAKASSCTYNIAIKALADGKFDDAKAIFQSIPDYADSKDKVNECDYQKGISLVAEKKYAEAIKIFEALGNYSESKTKILDAKYKFVNDNLSKDNKTTVEYLEDLIEARYLDSVAIRRKLLGATASENGVSACLNYSKTDDGKNITEADKSKMIYYHVTVSDPELYGKKLTVKFTTSVGYTERKTFTPTKANSTYTVTYPSTSISNYTVDFSVSSADGTELTEQTVTIK